MAEPDLQSMSVEELEKMMAEMPPPATEDKGAKTLEDLALEDAGPAPPLPEQEEKPAIEEKPATEEEKTPEAEAEAEVDPLDDFKAQWKAEREALEAKIELQMAHNSRLAGELGFLKKQPVPSRRPEAEAGPEAYDDERPAPRDSEVLDRVLRLEADIRRRDKDAAVESEALAIMAKPELEPLKALFPEIAENYRADILAVADIEDPETARLMTRRIVNVIVADAARIVDARERAARMEKRATSVANIERAKRVGTISGSGGAPPPPPRPKALKDMSNAELESLMTEITGG